MTLSNIEEVIKDASEGKIFILVDDEDKKKAIAEACFQQYWMADGRNLYSPSLMNLGAWYIDDDYGFIAVGDGIY